MNGRRGRPDYRGSSYDRRRRVQWMIDHYANKGGKTINCVHCGRRMLVNARERQWEIDRYPVCGHNGGRYVRGNIAPACRDCNGSRCSKPGVRCRGSATRPEPRPPAPGDKR